MEPIVKLPWLVARPDPELDARRSAALVSVRARGCSVRRSKSSSRRRRRRWLPPVDCLQACPSEMPL